MESTNYSFLPREVKSKETVILIGNEKDPIIQATKKRIEDAGRCVEISETLDGHSLGPCGLTFCSCTEPCMSIIHPSYAPQ